MAKAEDSLEGFTRPCSAPNSGSLVCPISVVRSGSEARAGVSDAASRSRAEASLTRMPWVLANRSLASRNAVLPSDSPRVWRCLTSSNPSLIRPAYRYCTAVAARKVSSNSWERWSTPGVGASGSRSASAPMPSRRTSWICSEVSAAQSIVGAAGTSTGVVTGSPPEYDLGRIQARTEPRRPGLWITTPQLPGRSDLGAVKA
jgi:hypothetical protein